MASKDFLGPEALAFMTGADYDVDMPVDQSDSSRSPVIDHLSASPPGNLYSTKMLQPSRGERKFLSGPRDEFFRNRTAQRTNRVESTTDVESPTVTGLPVKHNNSQSLLLGLPDELHLRFFEFRVFEETELKPISTGWIPQTWIPEISHVCSRWRSLALSHPILWTRIHNFNNPEHAEVMITRSGNMPIDVRIIISDFTTFAARARFARVFAKLWQVLDRTRSLELKGAPILSTWLKPPNQYPLGHYGNAQLNQRFKEAAEYTDEDLDTSSDCYTALQHDCLAAIETPSPILESFHAATTSPVSLEGDILGRNAPSLRSVHLLNYNFTWDKHMPCLSNLTTLTIKFTLQPPGIGTDPRVRVNIRTLVPMLSSLPLLTLICFDSIFQPISTEDQEWHATHYTPISLPKLRRLELTASHRHCTIFFQHVSFPTYTSTSVAMLESGSTIGTQQCGELLSILENRLDALLCPRALKVFAQSSRTVGVQAVEINLLSDPVSLGQDSGKSEAFKDDDPVSFRFVAVVESSDIYPILSLFYLDQIQYAHHLSRWVDLRLWKAFSVIPNLRLVHFTGVDFGYIDFWSNFGGNPEAPDTFAAIADDHNNFFPSLQAIIVDRCLFPPCYSNPMPPMFMVGDLAPYNPSILAASQPMKQEESFASDVAHREDQTLDRYRLLQFLERRKSGRGPLGFSFVNCEGLRKEILDSFVNVADTWQIQGSFRRQTTQSS